MSARCAPCGGAPYGRPSSQGNAGIAPASQNDFSCSSRWVNCFSGRLLTAEDLRTEQFYWLGKHRSHGRHLHGCGVVSGLGVTPAAAG